jgi:hypothetical protein
MTIAVIYSLTMAANGALVFYESVWPIPVPTAISDSPHGLFLAMDLAAVLWAVNLMWLVMPAALLILGLVHLHQTAYLAWRPGAAWTGVVAVSVAAGWQNIYCFDHWSGYGVYWRALIAAICQVAAGTAIIVLTVVTARREHRSTGAA